MQTRRDVSIDPAGSSRTDCETLPLWYAKPGSTNRSPLFGLQAAPPTLADSIARHAANGPDWPALLCADLPTFSYCELNRKLTDIRTKLRACGIGAASRIGVALPQGPEATLIGIALTSCCICFPLNPTLTHEEFEFELDRANLDALVLPAWFDSPLMSVIRANSIGLFKASKADGSLATVNVNQIIEVPAQRRRFGEPSPHSVCVIQMSSGSTGIPKLILVTHANLADISSKLQIWFRLTRNDRCASILPIYSGFGFKTTIIAALLTGGSVAIPRTQRPEEMPCWCSELSPTWFVATPTFLQAALDARRDAGNAHFAHTLRFFASTSAYLGETTRIGLEALLGIPGLEFYGLREAGVVAANPAPPALRKLGTVGLISPNDAAILSDAGEILPACTPGAIAVRGLGVSPGYIDSLPAGSDIPAPRNSSREWLLTGDLGFIDEDGFLSVIGRLKEIINRGGEKISPYEVEKALLEHPKIREAGAFAVPHPRLGENVAAAVVLHQGAETTSQDIRKFLRTNLPYSKVPQQIFVVEAIPKVSAGKIDRSQLSKSFAQRDARSAPPGTPLESAMTLIWQTLLKREDVGADENFFEAGGDSLLAIRLVHEIEQRLGLKIELEVIFLSSSLRDLCRDLEDGTIIENRRRAATVLPLKSRHANRVLYFIHSGFEFSSITNFLTGDVSAAFVTANDIQWMRQVMAAEDVISAIDQVSGAYAQAIVTGQRAGSFYLAGHSFGGIVAIETASKLQAYGVAPEFVFLLDTYFHHSLHRIVHDTLRNRWLTNKFKEVISGDRRELFRRARFICANALDRLMGSSLSSTPSNAFAGDFPSIFRAFRERGSEAYRGPSVALTSRVVLFRAERARDGKILRIDTSSGWASRLGENLTVVTVPADHFNIVGTHGRAIAHEISQLVG